MKLLTEDQLARRKGQELCAPNAYEVPDDEMLSLIAEVHETRQLLRRLILAQEAIAYIRLIQTEAAELLGVKLAGGFLVDI